MTGFHGSFDVKAQILKKKKLNEWYNKSELGSVIVVLEHTDFTTE